MREVPKLTEEEQRLFGAVTRDNGFTHEAAAKAVSETPVSLSDIKRNAVMAASQQVDPSVDAREAFGFMPMSLKGAAIRWRGL